MLALEIYRNGRPYLRSFGIPPHQAYKQCFAIAPHVRRWEETERVTVIIRHVETGRPFVASDRGPLS
jgi:hypothetical protein